MQVVPEMFPKKLEIPNYRLPILVPAGEKVHIPFTLPTAPTPMICVRRSPLTFESNYYHQDITIDVEVDGRRVNPYPMPLTHPFSVDFGIYSIKRYRIDLLFTNDTGTDALISFHVVPHLITTDVFDRWYNPLIMLGYRTLTDLAKVRP